MNVNCAKNPSATNNSSDVTVTALTILVFGPDRFSYFNSCHDFWKGGDVFNSFSLLFFI